MTIGYPPVQSQRPNDDERTVYLGSKNVDPAAGRPTPTPSPQYDPRAQQQPYPPANPQYAPQQSAAGYGHYGWGTPPAPQSSGPSKAAIIAVAAVVAVIAAATLGFALTRPGKHDGAAAKSDTTSQSSRKAAGNPAEPTAEQTPTPSPVAATLPPAALQDVLLTLPEAAAAIGTDATKGQDGFGETIWSLSKDTIVDQDCISVLPAETDSYKGSGYSNARQQFLVGATDNLVFTQSAATFTDAAAALRFVTATKAKWEKCAGRTINFRAPAIPTSQDTYFVFGAVTQTDGFVNIPSTQEGHGDWTCQNGLTTRANVVIDLVVCGHGMQASVARTATDKISDKVTAAIPR